MTEETLSNTPADADGVTPPEIPDFDILRKIGFGGFGSVWLARNRATGALRAVKLIARHQIGVANPAGREVVSIARMEQRLDRHDPHVLDIHHVGSTNQYVYLVMDLADPCCPSSGNQPEEYEPLTLKHKLEEGALSADEACDLAKQLLQGLASLHQAGMAHRDVKPANCLFVRGSLKLADFGLVVEADAENSRVGTEAYMPPQGPMDATADVYAAGLVIYQMLTGLSPRRFPEVGPQADRLTHDPQLGALFRVALEACQPESKQRFPSAGEMLMALEAGTVETAQGGIHRRKAMLVALGVVLVTALLAAHVFRQAPRTTHVNFVSYPFGAMVVLDGQELRDESGQPYVTPCTIDQLSARPHRVEFVHPERGVKSMGEIDFAAQQQVVGRW